MRTTNFDNHHQRQLLEIYLNSIIVATKPDIEIPEEIEHPSVAVHPVNDIDHANLVSKLQEHVCRESYCIKSGSCRFGYPKHSTESGKFERIENDWVFVPARNHRRIVPYNIDILRTWRSNMDITVVSSTTILMNYVTKYVTKSNQTDLMATM